MQSYINLILTELQADLSIIRHLNHSVVFALCVSLCGCNRGDKQLSQFAAL